MFARLLLLFILVPLADLMLLLLIAKWTHWTTSMLLVLVSGFVGVWIVRRKWNSARIILQDQLAENQIQSGQLTNGVIILFAAGLLITPGLITDFLGVLLLITSSREWCKRQTLRWLKSHFRTQMRTAPLDDRVIDGEVVSRSKDQSGLRRMSEPERKAS